VSALNSLVDKVQINQL